MPSWLPMGRAALDAPFRGFVLLSEPLEFTTREIVDALHEDHPHAADWAAETGGSESHDTARVGGCDARLINPRSGSRLRIASIPGRVPSEVEKVMAAGPDPNGAPGALDDHRAHLFFSIETAKTDYLHRYAAARALTAMMAVFARLPICMAVNFMNANRVVSPKDWMTAADIARHDMVCDAYWYMHHTTLGPEDGMGPREAEWRSWGLSAFLGYEMMLRGRLADPHVAPLMMYGILQRVLTELQPLRDGERITFVDGAEAVVRFLPEGPRSDVDLWVVLLPSSPIDERDVFGPRPPSPVVTTPTGPRSKALATALAFRGIR